MGNSLAKFCCCEEGPKNVIMVPKKSMVDRNIYTLRELSEEDNPETEYENDNLNYTVQTLKEIKINKSIIICRKNGLPSEEYLILDELGEGSYGVVLKVAHKITQNIRALKVIKKLNLEKNYSGSKLYDEIKILKDVDHPNIIKIFEFFEDEENYYMVTEYCPDGDLGLIMEKMNTFNEKIVKILMFQILTAVNYLHSRKIIHGDLKLENILIESLSLKTGKSFRSSITYDLDKLKNLDYKQNFINNTNQTKINLNNNGLNNLENKQKNPYLSNTLLKNETKISNQFENGMNIVTNQFKNEININELDKTKFNQSENLDIFRNFTKNNNICDSEYYYVNSNINSNFQNQQNKIKKNDSLDFDEMKLTTESFNLQKKSSAINLHQRKILYMKFNKSQKGSKTLNFVNPNKKSFNKNEYNTNIIQHYNFNNECIQENSMENSMVNTERFSNDDIPLVFHEKENKDYVSVKTESNKNEKSLGIFTEENVSDDNILQMENFVAKNLYYQKKEQENSYKKKEEINKLKIPNLNFKLINNPNNNEISNGYNKNKDTIYNVNSNNDKHLNTLEELEKNLKRSGDNIFFQNLQSRRTYNLNENNSNNLNNTNNFETLRSDSNTLSINTDLNNCNYQQQQKDFNEVIKNYNNNENLNELPFENFSNYEIKLIDFGCSKIFRKGTKKFKDLIGTLFYIAPEIIKNNYNEKCDLWSCGVIMYILFVGFPPFFAMTDTEVFQQILSADYSFDYPDFAQVSESAKDLMSKLMELNPKKRLSAKEALEHEFFSEISTYRLNEYNLDYSVLNNLKKNKIEYKFHQAVVSYLAYNFATKEEIVNLRKIFKAIDTDSDGRISKNELLLAYRRINFEMTEQELNEILNVIDSDKSGYLEYEEFITAMINKKTLLTDKNLHAAFDLFDQDKNGKISIDEIKTILIGKNNNIPEKVIVDLINEINGGKSDEINFDEFKNIIYQVISDE